MQTWHKALIPPFLAQEHQKPTGCHRRLTWDRLELLVAIYGDGGPTSGYVLRVFLELAELLEEETDECPLCGELWQEYGEPPHRLRFPTLEELQEILDAFIPRGAVMQPLPLTSNGPGHDLQELLEGKARTETRMIQVGAAEGTAAARHILLATPGGHHGHA